MHIFHFISFLFVEPFQLPKNSKKCSKSKKNLPVQKVHLTLYFTTKQNCHPSFTHTLTYLIVPLSQRFLQLLCLLRIIQGSIHNRYIRLTTTTTTTCPTLIAIATRTATSATRPITSPHRWHAIINLLQVLETKIDLPHIGAHIQRGCIDVTILQEPLDQLLQSLNLTDSQLTSIHLAVSHRDLVLQLLDLVMYKKCKVNFYLENICYNNCMMETVLIVKFLLLRISYLKVKLLRILLFTNNE